MEVAILTNFTLFKVREEGNNFTENIGSNITETTSIYRAGNMTKMAEIESIWLWTMVDGLLMVVILCGNTLTILAVTLSRRLSSLISNQFVLNLAVSDLTVGLTIPYHLAFYLNQELSDIKFTCVLRFILITLACCASIFNLTAIAVDRYIAILHPLHYSRYMSKAVTRTLMSIGWTLAVGFSAVPIFWNNFDSVDMCILHKVFPKEYTINVLVPIFSVIWLVMLVLYWRIWREAALHAKRMRTTTCCPAGPNDWKSVQVVLMVLGSFSICWMPYVTVICWQTLGNPRAEDSQLIYKVVFSLAMANSGINPLIYAWKNTGFRRAFLLLLRCRHPDSSTYDGGFRNERKLPLDTISRPDTTADAPRPSLKIDTDNQTNNNGVKSERCRIIENLAYDGGLPEGPRCHIIENLGFEEGPEMGRMRMMDSPDSKLETPSDGRECNV